MNHIVSEVTERKYWDIGEVSIKISQPPSKIRFWTDFFKMDIKRGSAKKRKFTKEDIEKLSKINSFVQEGYHLKAIFKKLNPL